MANPTRADAGAVPVAVARACHAVIAAVVLAALLIDIVETATGSSPPGTGTRMVRLFSYFTVESNIIVLAATLALLRRPDRDGRIWRIVRLDALLGIVVTGIVFAAILAPTVHPTGAQYWSNLGLHYIAPWATTVVWLLFGPRPRITWPAIGWAFAWPVLWIAYTFVHGAVTGWYPYPFLDVATKGYAHAVISTAVVVVLAAVLALAFRALDRLPVLGAPHGLSRPNGRQGHGAGHRVGGCAATGASAVAPPQTARRRWWSARRRGSG